MTRLRGSNSEISAAATQTSNLALLLTKLPLLFSFGILGATWVSFVFTITIPEVLLRRHDTWHFLEQLVIFNALMGLTTMSLLTAATRSPGHPDPSLAPYTFVPGEESPQPFSPSPTNGQLIRASRSRSRPPRLDSMASGPDTLSHQITSPAPDNDDDIPLRYLRNSQWLKGRPTKDRPSPLPLRVDRLAHDAPSPDSRTSIETAPLPRADSHFPSISPFPLGLSPFVPTTISEAGGESDFIDEAEDSATSGQDIGSTGEIGLRARRTGYWMEDETHASDCEQQADPETILDGLESEVAMLLEVQEQDQGSHGMTTGRSTALMAKSNTGGPRFCRKCKGWKPDRCHHCSYCKKCVLKMDHHCVWLATCIGHRNYKPFLLFISYGTILAIYVALEGAYQVYKFFTDESISSSMQVEFAPVVFMLLTMAGGFFALAVGGLAGYHWFLVCNNMSTLEQMSYTHPSALLPPPHSSTPHPDPTITHTNWKPDHLLTRNERRRLSEEARDINVYDLGWKRNIKQVLLGDDHALRTRTGMFVWRAIWPLAAARNGDGHGFEYDEDKLERLRRLTKELRLEVTTQWDEEADDELESD